MSNLIKLHYRKSNMSIEDPTSSFWKAFLEENKLRYLVEIGDNEYQILNTLAVCQIDNFYAQGSKKFGLTTAENPLTFHFFSKEDRDDITFTFEKSYGNGWSLKNPSEKPLLKHFLYRSLERSFCLSKRNSLVMTEFAEFIDNHLETSGEETSGTYMIINSF